jgi:hypothetical protein
MRQLCDPWQLRKAVRDGRVVHLGRNRYALPGAQQALLAAGRLHGVASHLSAAQTWGWAIKFPPSLPVVTVPRGRKVARSRREEVDLRWQDMPKSAVHSGAVTSRAQTVIDCARTLPLDEALSVADSALREGRVNREELRIAAATSPRSGRVRAQHVVELADGSAENPFESCLRAVAIDVPGLDPVAQLTVPGVGHADVGDARLGLLIEADSYAYHAEDAAFRYDIRRYTAMVRLGWTVVRFCWEDVMFRSDQVRAVLVDIVERLTRQGRSVGRCAACPEA